MATEKEKSNWVFFSTVLPKPFFFGGWIFCFFFGMEKFFFLIFFKKPFLGKPKKPGVLNKTLTKTLFSPPGRVGGVRKKNGFEIKPGGHLLI